MESGVQGSGFEVYNLISFPPHPPRGSAWGLDQGEAANMKTCWNGTIDEGSGSRPVFCLYIHPFCGSAYSNITQRGIGVEGATETFSQL